MSNDLDTKIWLSLDSLEHQIRRSAYLATAEPFQKKIYAALELIKEAKEEVEKRLDNKP
jgi:competence transcription factor ComK